MSTNTKTLPRLAEANPVRVGFGTPWRARLVLALLGRLTHGSLEVHLPDGRALRYGDAGATQCSAVIAVHDWSVFAEAVTRGDVGFAESYLRGGWTSPDPAALFDVLARNRATIERAVYGHPIGRAVDRVRHVLRANTRAGSRRNIAAHYDLGNEFYSLWLDSSMTYSSALFSDAHDATQSLESAQAAKYRRVLERLDPRPGAHILEIGCGWGGFAEFAARERDVRVTGISLSREQLRYAVERAERAGLAERVRFEYRDYRDCVDTYDHIVSIEMYEAVGERYWPTYFGTIKRLLRAGGDALVQAITIDESLFQRYRAGTDFIQQYIFPGGMLATPARFAIESSAQGLAVEDAFAFGPDYALTLRRWRDAFVNNLTGVRAQGFDERFIRMWELYLAYCEAGFTSGSTNVHHYHLRA
jgi:cyclopropane-fatty-acyl-phospholipid synthase